MIVGVASDHRGYRLKQELLSKMPSLVDYGTNSDESTDYPIYAFLIGEAIKEKKIDFGILICGSGIGMSIACNKVKGVRCAKISNKEEAIYTRNDNDANVLAISENHSVEETIEMINNFINTPFSTEEKYVRRLNEILDYEERNA